MIAHYGAPLRIKNYHLIKHQSHFAMHPKQPVPWSVRTKVHFQHSTNGLCSPLNLVMCTSKEVEAANSDFPRLVKIFLHREMFNMTIFGDFIQLPLSVSDIHIRHSPMSNYTKSCNSEFTIE